MHAFGVRIDRGSQKAAARPHLNDDDESSALYLLFGEEGSAAIPMLSPPAVDNYFYPRRATEDSGSGNADPGPPSPPPFVESLIR